MSGTPALISSPGLQHTLPWTLQQTTNSWSHSSRGSTSQLSLTELKSRCCRGTFFGGLGEPLPAPTVPPISPGSWPPSCTFEVRLDSAPCGHSSSSHLSASFSHLQEPVRSHGAPRILQENVPLSQRQWISNLNSNLNSLKRCLWEVNDFVFNLRKQLMTQSDSGHHHLL